MCQKSVIVEQVATRIRGDVETCGSRWVEEQKVDVGCARGRSSWIAKTTKAQRKDVVGAGLKTPAVRLRNDFAEMPLVEDLGRKAFSWTRWSQAASKEGRWQLAAETCREERARRDKLGP